jgi:hypothetical protein
MSIPTVAPSRIRKGTTAQWTVFLSDYEPGVWTLVYQFAMATDAQSVTATDNGDGSFLVTIPATGTGTTTDDFTAGIYSFVALVSKSPEVYEVDHGTVEILPSFSTAVDGRTQVKRDLDACDAFRTAKIAKGDVSSYSIGTGNGSRSLAGIPWPEFLQLHATLRAEYAREVQAERKSLGKSKRNRVVVRFGNPGA